MTDSARQKPRASQALVSSVSQTLREDLPSEERPSSEEDESCDQTGNTTCVGQHFGGGLTWSSGNHSKSNRDGPLCATPGKVYHI